MHFVNGYQSPTSIILGKVEIDGCKVTYMFLSLYIIMLMLIKNIPKNALMMHDSAQVFPVRNIVSHKPTETWSDKLHTSLNKLRSLRNTKRFQTKCPFTAFWR